MAKVCDECGYPFKECAWGIVRHKRGFAGMLTKEGEWKVCGQECAHKLMKRVDQERGRGVGYSSGRKG